MVLGELERTPEGEPILGGLRDERRRLRELGVTGWVEAELHLTVLERIEEALGHARTRDFHRDLLLEHAIRRATQTPLLRPIALGAQRIYGRTPASFLRMAPTMHRLFTKGCGTLEAEASEGSVEVRLQDLPRLLRERRGLLTTYEGMCEAILADLGQAGTVTRSDADLGIGRCVITVRW